MSNASIVRLLPAVQHYDWGGSDFIASLLGVPNPELKPFAEMWLGAHPKAPSLVDLPAGRAPLTEWIAADPPTRLGRALLTRFGPSLPFLLKVLDARRMLSLQVHPARRQAEEGYDRENAAGVAIHAPHRNYRDRNHKPEVHAALTEFFLLHGFRPLEEIVELLRQTPEFRGLMPDFGPRLAHAGGDATLRARITHDLYGHIMHLPQDRVDEILDALILRLEAGPPPPKDSPAFWAIRAAREFPLPGGRRDRGIFSVFLMNLVRLRPGQGTFQPAGLLHAYLEGINVELMANSDNVLRGGLTPKHVDVEELLRIVRFDDGPCPVLEAGGAGDAVCTLQTPAAEFELSRIVLRPGMRLPQRAVGPQILLAIEGTAAASMPDSTIDLARGQSAFAAHGAEYDLLSRRGAVLYRASAGRGE